MGLHYARQYMGLHYARQYVQSVLAMVQWHQVAIRALPVSRDEYDVLRIFAGSNGTASLFELAQTDELRAATKRLVDAQLIATSGHTVGFCLTLGGKYICDVLFRENSLTLSDLASAAEESQR